MMNENIIIVHFNDEERRGMMNIQNRDASFCFPSISRATDRTKCTPTLSLCVMSFFGFFGIGTYTAAAGCLHSFCIAPLHDMTSNKRVE